jgi:hypothetical protein
MNLSNTNVNNPVIVPQFRGSRWKAFAAAWLLLLGTGAVLAVPESAQAATVDGITSVTIDAPNPAVPTQPLRQYQRFTVNATWSLSDPQVGDSFSLSFPSPVQSYAASFALTATDGTDIGTCAVTAESIACTLTNSGYLATHTGINGTLFFQAQANAVTAVNTPLLFTTGAGVTVAVPLPGGSIVGNPPSPEPTVPQKYGWENADGKDLQWEVLLPGSSLLANTDGPITVTDTFDTTLTLVPSSLTVIYVLASNWNGGNYGPNYTTLTQGTGPGTFDVANHPGTSSFDVTINEPVTNDGRLYMIGYETALPTDAPVGSTYHNTVTGVGQAVPALVTLVSAGGSADGTAIVTPPTSTPTPTPAPAPAPAPARAPAPAVHLPVVSG